MLFNSIQFLVFFPIVVMIYFLLRGMGRNIWLLIASYLFYMSWNPKYALLLLFVTGVTYVGGICIGKINDKTQDDSTKIEENGKKKSLKQKKILLWICMLLNLGLLFFFKYLEFTWVSISHLFGKLGISFSVGAMDILLPVGISFFIFQALGYVIDVYRGEQKAEKNILHYALFISFFPQLLAGPIGRSKQLLVQFKEVHAFDHERMKRGLLLMLFGYFQKLVIADRIRILVDTVFTNYVVYDGLYILIAVLLFAVQIYCDFAGYSNIAIGAAEIMGFSLIRNFNAPYLSQSTGEFWRRWHISLSTWFRDYLYIPLGGNRKGNARKYLNLMIVFAISGLWHGAMWTFVLWGLLNGAYQVVGALLAPSKSWVEKKGKIKTNTFSYKLGKVMITFLLIDFSWLFFRASGLKEAILLLKSLFGNFNPWILTDGSLYQLGLDQKNFQLMLISIIVLLMADILQYKKIAVRDFILSQNLWFRWGICIVGIVGVLLFGIWGSTYDASTFLYFQF